MTSERQLSKKKTTQQTISTSPALKARIEEYVKENHEMNPDDNRFKSISAFHNYVLEKTMDCFDKGKTLDDFDTFVDSTIQDFFDKISWKALIPYYENAVKPNKYMDPTFKKLPFFYLTIRRLYLSIMDPYDTETIKNLYNRLRNYLLSNNLTKESNLDLFTGKNKTDLTGIFEYRGIYRNLSFENCKYMAAIFGLLGVKIDDCLYSEKEVYCRFDLKATDLFFREELVRSERVKLINHNLSQLINYSRIINDNDYYLWMKIAEDNNAFISFNNSETRKEWFDLIKMEFEKYSEKEDYLLNLLKFFQKLHWIDIESERELTFRIRLSEVKNHDDIQHLLKFLSKKSKVSQNDGKYYLETIS
ncbi:MAG: hypothetical protein ACFE94_06055 [Candidatus Hodarchaeota archaeon]